MDPGHLRDARHPHEAHLVDGLRARRRARPSGWSRSAGRRARRLPLRTGGASYIEPEVFEAAGVELEYFGYDGYREYSQLFPPFDHFVSILDLLFNEGPNATRYMLSFNAVRLSIVTTLYRSAPHLEEFHRRCQRRGGDAHQRLRDHPRQRRLAGRSLQIALELHVRDPHVRVIDLSRNFGHHKAMMTGLAHARGDLVFLIDCDLEEDPALAADVSRHARHRTGVDVVYGVQAERKGGWLERTAAGCSSASSTAC